MIIFLAADGGLVTNFTLVKFKLEMGSIMLRMMNIITKVSQKEKEKKFSDIFTIVIRNRKIVWKHGLYLDEFQCKLKIMMVARGVITDP